MMYAYMHRPVLTRVLIIVSFIWAKIYSVIREDPAGFSNSLHEIAQYLFIYLFVD